MTNVYKVVLNSGDIFTIETSSDMDILLELVGWDNVKYCEQL